MPATLEGAPSAVIWNGTALEPSELAALPGLQGGALLLDRGLHYGDGLFETIACRGGRPNFLELHLERLMLGCRRLGLGGTAFEGLRAEVEALAAGSVRSIVKVIVTRGRATGRGYAPRGDERPTRVVLRYDWPPEHSDGWHDGVAACIASFTLGENPRLAGLKHLNRLELVLARADLAESPYVEALLPSTSGWVVSGTFSNVFIATGSRLRTPRIDRCGVAGVMRRVVLQLAGQHDLSVEEANLTPADVAGADEVFLTNARIGIWPVHTLGAHRLGIGPMTRRVQGLLEGVLQEEGA